MTEEPRWPTATAVTRAFDSNFPAGSAYHPDMLAQAAIDACRAAWLASVDDPSCSPVGEVRRNPETTGYLVIRTADSSQYPWYVFRPDSRDDNRVIKSGDGHERVKGWPVLGAVPGTPAAEAKP